MSKTGQDKPVEFYLKRKYPFLVHASEDGGYVAEIEELPGCVTQADSLQEVEERIEDARRSWIEVAYANGLEIPPPRTETEYSGKFIVRVPRSLHRELAEAASREGVSLNQYVLTLLSGGTISRTWASCLKEVGGLQKATLAQERSVILLRPSAAEWADVHWSLPRSQITEFEALPGAGQDELITNLMKEKVAA